MIFFFIVNIIINIIIYIYWTDASLLEKEIKCLKIGLQKINECNYA